MAKTWWKQKHRPIRNLVLYLGRKDVNFAPKKIGGKGVDILQWPYAREWLGSCTRLYGILLGCEGSHCVDLSRRTMVTDTCIWFIAEVSFQCKYAIRLSFFYLLDYITHRTLILENQKKKKNYKSQKMQAGCDKNCSKCCLHKAVIILKCLN